MKKPAPPSASDDDRSVATRSVERALAGRYASYLEEVQQLIDAGVRVMQRGQRFDPRVGEILAEAGLSNQAFYRHFRSKDEFLLAVLDDGVRKLVGYLRHRMEAAASPRAQVSSWIEGVLAQALNPQAAEATRPFVIPQAHLAERFPTEVASSQRKLTELLEDAIAAGAAAGEFPDADPERDARAIYDLTMGWLQRQLVEAESPSSDDAEHVLRFAMKALGPDPASV